MREYSVSRHTALVQVFTWARTSHYQGHFAPKNLAASSLSTLLSDLACLAGDKFFPVITQCLQVASPDLVRIVSNLCSLVEHHHGDRAVDQLLELAAKVVEEYKPPSTTSTLRKSLTRSSSVDGTNKGSVDTHPTIPKEKVKTNDLSIIPGAMKFHLQGLMRTTCPAPFLVKQAKAKLEAMLDALRNHKDYTFFTTITIDQLMGVIVIDDKSQGFAALAVFLRQKQADYQQAVSDVPAAFTSVSADPAGQDGDDDCLLEAGRQIPMI